MKLVDEIIDLLSAGESNLSTALFKTKVLLHKLGEKDLLSWVNGELKGYSDTDKLPNYRVLPVIVHGNVSNLAYRYQSHILPTLHIDKKIRKKLDTSYLTQSIAVIEEYAQQGDIQITIAPEFYPLLSKGLAGGYQIESAWGIPSAGAMTQVITEVTSRLLDFVLELSEKIPEELEENELKSKSKEIGVSDLFNNAVFGDNATIVVGDSNAQHIENTIVKNDFESLKSLLLQNKVAEDDITELSQALKNDEGCTEHEQKSLGKNVSQWIGNMVSKAASSAWNINVGAAGSLLATAIGKYYGF